MNEQFPQKGISIFDDNDDKDSYKTWQEKNKLSLRKKHIFNILLSKRKPIFMADIQESKYTINIKNISTNEELIINPELYIKTKFDIKHWFKYLFSKNINEIKEALFIIELYIWMQVKEITFEKRVLSRNDTDLINVLCDYLNNEDFQISFYALKCLTCLYFFPDHILARINSERNMKKIMEFFNKKDFNFGHQILYLLINCNTERNQRIFFVNHGIIERLHLIMKISLDKLESKHHIFIIKSLNNISKLFEEYDKYTTQQIMNWFLPFLPFVKNTIKNFVKSPWAENKDSHLYLEIIKFYTNINIKNKDILLNIVNDEFSRILIEFYYKINANEDKIFLLKIYAELLSNEDNSICEYFIKDGILQLFMNEINLIGYKNLTFLDAILFACSNIACGTINQIQQLYIEGLVWKCFDIIQYCEKQYLSVIIKKIIYNAIYVLTEVILGGNKKVNVEILLYQNYEIVNIFIYAIKNILDSYNELSLLQEISQAIYELIKLGQSDLEEKSLEEFKSKLIINGMEEIIDDIIFNHGINEDLKERFNYIKSFLKE